MPELTLERVEPDRYTLSELGTLRSARRHRDEIEVDGTKWKLRRARLSFAGVIEASDAATGARMARYVPSGFLGLRGIYRGAIHLDDRELDWRGDHHMAEHFTLRESGHVLAEFDAGSDERPVSVSLFGLQHIETLPLLFCCHIVKRVVDMTMEVGTPGPPHRLTAPDGGQRTP
jgi:hypothetical protein